MTWSMRKRGNVQRTHIITKTSVQPLKMNTVTLMTLPSTTPMMPRSSVSPNSVVNSNGKPMLQPPRNMMQAMPLTANMLPYSAMKMTSQRKPEYSVWKPATSSLSASARSNGARLQLAIAQVKYVQNAANVNGSWNKYLVQMPPDCWRATAIRFMLPATMTGTRMHRVIG